MYPALLSTLLLELVVAVELVAVAQSPVALRVRVAPQQPVTKHTPNPGRVKVNPTEPAETRTATEPTGRDCNGAHRPRLQRSLLAADCNGA